MSNEQHDGNTKYAIIGGLALAAFIIMGKRNKENEQLMLEERSRQMETRHIKSLRRQEFLHNIIYKIFGISPH